MDRVKGKVALVTGAASGLGRGSALLLAKEGAKVVVTDINEAGVKETAEQIKREGGEVLCLRQDASSESDWKEVIEKTLAEFGKLDVLLNNAGVVMFKSIKDTSLEDWRELMSTDLDGVFLGTKYAMEAMRKSGGGSIINISSTAGIVGTNDDASAYHAAKGGVRLFTKAAALECSKAGYDYNIRVNSIHPGVIRTGMTAGFFTDEVMMQKQTYRHIIGFFGDPIDIAYGVLYLASDESRFVTGAELVIDGGWTAQ